MQFAKTRHSIMRTFTLLALSLSISNAQDTIRIDLFESTNSGGTIELSTVWGYLDQSEFPWIKTVSMGEIYVAEASTTDNLYFWSQDFGWAYTDVHSFPRAYLYGTALNSEAPGWVLFDLTDQSHRKYFIEKERRWFAYRVVSSDELPLEWQNIHIRESSYRPLEIDSGRYHMRRSRNVFSGLAHENYIFNEDEGWIVPANRFHLRSTSPDNVVAESEFPLFMRYRWTVESDKYILTEENILTGEQQVTEYAR